MKIRKEPVLFVSKLDGKLKVFMSNVESNEAIDGGHRPFSNSTMLKFMGLLGAMEYEELQAEQRNASFGDEIGFDFYNAFKEVFELVWPELKPNLPAYVTGKNIRTFLSCINSDEKKCLKHLGCESYDLLYRSLPFASLVHALIKNGTLFIDDGDFLRYIETSHEKRKNARIAVNATASTQVIKIETTKGPVFETSLLKFVHCKTKPRVGEECYADTY